MATFNTKKFAEQIKKSNPDLDECTVGMFDDDLRLVMQVRDTTEDCEIVAEWDTGEDGDYDSTLFHPLMDRLIDALNAVGIKASRYESEEDSLPPPSSMSVRSLLLELSAFNQRLVNLPGKLSKVQLDAVSEITNGNAAALASIRTLLGIDD